MSEDIDKKISFYEDLAQQIRFNIAARKRPLIVELAGLPKSGKTTVVNSLSLFLRRNDIKCVVVTERAAVCPINNKLHVDFNVWTGCTSLVNILNYKQHREHMVIIVDRGVFDSLVWLNLLHKRGKLKDDELKSFETFFLMERWRKEFDLVISMKASVEESIKREFKDLLTKKEGSIMNRPFLTEYLQVLDECYEKYAALFKKVKVIDTTEIQPLEGSEKCVSEVLQCLKELSDERLVLISKEDFKDRMQFVGFNQDRRIYEVLERVLKTKKYTKNRSDSEADNSSIQIVVVCVITYQNQIAIFKKIEVSSDKRLHEKQMVWIGGHLQSSDLENEEHTVYKSMLNCLNRELNEEIEFALESNMKLKGLVYDNTHQRSTQHLGVIFSVELKNEFVYKSLADKVFKEMSGQATEISFVPRTSEFFQSEIASLEPWSVDILKGLFNINVDRPTGNQQMYIF